MKNMPPPARELAIIDQELVRLDVRRGQLLARRAYLLSAPTLPVRPGVPQASPPASPPVSPPASAPPSAQNVLLVLGGVLLAIAAIAFTLVSWGHLGIGGRAAVLTGVTVLTLAVPVPLLRRGLRSTAEAVAALGLVLTVLDAYALYRVALPGTDALGYSAAATAALAALWAGYGTALGALRGPLPAAVVTAQLPLILWALATGSSALTVAWALLVTAAPDTALALRTESRTVRCFAGAAAGTAASGALLVAGELSVSAWTPLVALRPGALLLTAAAAGLFVARRHHVRWGAVALVCAAVAGLAGIAAVGGVVRTAVPDGWTTPGYLLCAVAPATVLRTRLPRPLVRGLAGAAGLVAALSVLWALPSVAVALLGEVAAIPEIWTGVPAPPWPGRPAAPVVLLAVAGALAAQAYGPHRDTASTGAKAEAGIGAEAGTGVGTRARALALRGSLALGWAGVLVLPLALEAPRPVAVATPLVLTAMALTVVVGPRVPGGPPVRITALVCALAGSVAGSLTSLGSRAATVTALAVLSALFAGAAVSAVARAVARAGEGARVRGADAVLACTAVVCTTALVTASCAAAGLSAGVTAVAVLAVPATVALLAAGPSTRPVAAPIEITACGAALLAVVLASGRAPVLALVLALCGVIAAGTAVRAGRRAVAGHTATALFVLAAWVRLAASDVSVPEAYTLPVTLPALAVGLLRRRRDPAASSWTAYGPGLAVTLLPSLLAAWGDPHWSRPLLLGLAALALTLAGARLGLQAPLVLGGTVLALVALHELAPYVVQVVGALPRWLPPALAGLLLLAVGATYEQRLKDAHRVRRSLGRMR
ncbi:SCO7613 C-terminal domain-containing membrane protein [Streptomyces lushanensis]|uniref:SCO7613 C-terminal domain-containing membrane protein n=1 Tax=Streptomyces lushanensis TaxID=1434255 RepID=UPI00082FE9FE|nr:hypothetical protein [Streptomyces lushanensis]